MGFFNGFDMVLCTIIFISTLISIVRGFIKETLSLLSWLLAFYVAYQFFESVADLFAPYLSNATVRAGIAFVGLFIVSVIGLSLLSYGLGKVIKVTGLKGIDTSLGALFGVARGVLIVNLVLIVGSMLSLTSYIWWRQSFLVDKFTPQVVWLKQNLPEFNHRFQRYAHRGDHGTRYRGRNLERSEIV